MLPHDPDNLFEDDLAGLLDSFDDNDNSPSSFIETNSDNDLEDLASLFEADFSEDNDNSQLNLNSLPLDEEIQEIFSEEGFWEADHKSSVILDTDKIADLSPKPTSTSNLNFSDTSEFDEEIFNLFSEDSTEQDINYPEILRQKKDSKSTQDYPSSDNLWNDLEEIIADEIPSGPLEPPLAPVLETFIDNKTDKTFPSFYENFEDLEKLLAQSATLLEKEINFHREIEQLEALINAPCSQAADEFQTPSPNTNSANNRDNLDDDIEQLLRQTHPLPARTPAAVTGQQRPPNRNPNIEQTMRVPIKQLDNLSNLIGELVVKRNRLEQDQERQRLFLDNLLNQVQQLSDVGGRMQDLYERTLLEGALLATRNRARHDETPPSAQSQASTSDTNQHFDQDLGALEMDRFTGFHLLSQEMIELIVRVRESASDIQFIVDETDQVARSLRQVSTQLQEGMTKSRMVPFAQSADHLPRAIRDISVKLNKQAKLVVEGRDVLIDKMIIEHLSSPMIHLVNNAMTHGIESPEQRRANGKPAEGQIIVRAFLQGNQTVISISDDGAGIDVKRVKRKAIEKDLITPEEATILTEQEVYDFLFHPGFSTKDKADDFAGRGVGLDVVRKAMSEIRGTVTIDSTLGKGTTFTIRLPLTLSISKALCCLSNHARIAFPMDGVEDMKDFMPSEIKTNEQGQPCIPWYDGLIPFQPLNDLLSYNRQIHRSTVYGGRQEEDTISIVILRSANNYLAVQIDQVLGEQEIVIKQIEGPIPKPVGIAGATVLGDGSVMPIGDVLELIEIAQGKLQLNGTNNPWIKAAYALDSEPEDNTESTVLIVDDSITVRGWLSMCFSKAGYRVEQARDGQEAWEKLRSGLPCDIIFCDIEMPRMNGLELLSNIQKDEKLCDLPVAMLTSRGAEKHRKVAAKLGASGYYTKPCIEKEILDAAKRMIAGEVLLQGSVKPRRKLKVDAKTTVTPRPIGELLSGHQASYMASSRAMAQKPNLVLIVDDSVMVREMLSMTFNKAGYEIEQARDGQEAWDKLRSGLPCDLILCDIEMPRMNGLELLSRLQQDKKLSTIPIAMITSRGAQKMQNIAAERGAKGYFVKPYIEEVLLDASKRLIAGEVLLERDSKVEG